MTTIVTCSECSEADDAGRYSTPYRVAMLELRLCFRCHFWAEKVRIRDEADVARINGRHFQICPEDAHPHDRGFGGQRFVIVFHDGRRVESTNLWCQGDIPEHFRARLPDNATWGER